MIPISTQYGILRSKKGKKLTLRDLVKIQARRDTSLQVTLAHINKRARIASFCPGLLILSILRPQEPF